MRSLIILVDGMRPDAIKNLPTVQKIIKKATYTFSARTVMPSVTLPCHMSLFHSVEPSRHGTTTNTYTPQVRPVKGLCEVLFDNKKKSAFFYNWEPLRDLSRPSMLDFSYFQRGEDHYDKANVMVTNAAIEYLNNNYIDFAFLYLGYTDAAGHNFGWMSDEYMNAIDNSWENIDRILEKLPDDYNVIITADHGGHERMHGTDLNEDMIIPIIAIGNAFGKGVELGAVSILDIAPTITKIHEIEPDSGWDGRSFI